MALDDTNLGTFAGHTVIDPRHSVVAPALAKAGSDGAIEVRARTVPLAEVTQAWNAETDDRIVIAP